jgi:pimeloyl-ACP methyl ester carboxylesterase
MIHQRSSIWWKAAYIVFILIVASCSGHPTQNQNPSQSQIPIQSQGAPQGQNAGQDQRPISQKDCLSVKRNTPCFYWRERSANKNEKLIIFVHGVFSTPSDTWGGVEGGNTWPELVREDLRFKNFDVYLFNYHSTHLTSGQMIHEIAIREMDTLKDSEDFEQYKEIYFIAHSMGGLIVKSLLTHLNRGDDVPLLRRVKAVITLGTPSQGASLAVLGHLILDQPQLKDMEPKRLNAWLSDMEKFWNQLMDDRKQFQYPRTYCAYETRPYFFGYIVIPQEAAASRCDGTTQGFHLDHSELAMPTSMYDDPYKWVMDKIHKVSREVTSQNSIAKQDLSDPDDKTIFIECDYKPFPKTIPPDGSPKVTMIFPKSHDLSVYTGLGDLGKPGSVNIWWDPYKNDGYGHMCQLTNYGKVAVFRVVITFGLRFKEAIADIADSKVLKKGATIHSVGWIVPITKLAPGPSGTVSFWVINTSPYYVEAFLPEFADLQRLGESKRRKVTLLRQDEGPILMHINPIKYPMTPPW